MSHTNGTIAFGSGEVFNNNAVVQLILTKPMFKQVFCPRFDAVGKQGFFPISSAAP